MNPKIIQTQKKTPRPREVLKKVLIKYYYITFYLQVNFSIQPTHHHYNERQMNVMNPRPTSRVTPSIIETMNVETPPAAARNALIHVNPTQSPRNLAPSPREVRFWAKTGAIIAGKI